MPYCDNNEDDAAAALTIHARLRACLELLLQRWGLVSREMLQASGLIPSIIPSWQQAYRELLRMEMEGEIIAGRYFNELAGVQFMPGRHISLFTHLESRAASPFLASIHDPIFPAGAPLFQKIRRVGSAGIFVTQCGFAAALYAGGRRIVLLDAACEQQSIEQIADMLYERVRRQKRTLTIKEIAGADKEKLRSALLERGARRCADGVEVGWR
jgi:hypothetical protein